ncbi:MAG TPA: hypothetical protein VNW52_05665, partial [Burkholderiaceae bacterium]|nr:hypothetical protein [Burkholderiaceae bacterium]
NNLKAYLARASFDGNRATRYSLVTSPMGKHLCESMSFGPLNSYQATLASYTLIIKEIERLYPKETRG